MVDGRFGLDPTTDERTLLTTFLEWHRETLLRKCSGLSDPQLRQRAVPSSDLSLIGLMRHLAAVERWYLQVVVAGEQPPELFDATHGTDADFNDTASATGPDTLDLWRTQIEQSRRIVAERALDTVGTNPETGQRHSLRWVLTHMIDEYARHNGHADLIREAIDGATGE